MICEFCGKTFKGEATFKKHHCKQMDRFKQFDENAFELYVAWQKGARVYKADTGINRRLAFTQSRMFEDFLRLLNFQSQHGMKTDTAYPFYLGENIINKNEWCRQETLNKFIIYRAQNENYALSVERSNNYLAGLGLAFETCPKFTLYQLLKDGLISKNLFLSKKVDVNSVLPADWIENLKGVL